MAMYEFKLPDIGEGVVEGEIVKWLIKPGDQVSEDQPMVEVMTDKATVTIPCPKKGRVLELFGKEGDIAKVHHALVRLELDGAAPAAVAAPATAAASVHTAVTRNAVPAVQRAVPGAATAAVANGHKVLATPVTRRIAREHGIDLQRVPGTGPQGRVLKSDVEAMLNGGGASAPTQTRSVERSAPLVLRGGDERIAIKGLRKRIADKMVKAKFTAPHYTFVEEIDASPLVEVRDRINATLKQDAGAKISFLPFFCKALVAAFKKFPQVNANMDEATSDLIVRGEYNIGIAAATAEGLTVPVVKNVDRLSLKELGDEITRLGTAARERKLTMEDLSGGTFTITSLGQTGGLFATPIINHPEVAIMGVHRMRKRPVVDDRDQIVIRQRMYRSFSFDHRVIDGAVGADFAYEVIRHLERPERLMLGMA